MSPLSNKRAQTLILVLILVGQLMLVLDGSIITTALPTIQRELDFAPASLSWVQNAYTLAFGGLLLLGARMGDILGRRRVFSAGIGVFTVASLAGGLAQTPEWLLIARAVQGVAAAVAAPSTLALLTATFTEGKERGRAIALFSSITGAGMSLGLVIGGLLTDLISWRWGLFINVPIGIVLVLVTPRLVDETERVNGHFDVVGAVTSTVGMASIVYGFVRASAQGWLEPVTVAAFVVGVVLIVGFVFNELRATQPITPLHLFASRDRSGANFARLLMVGGMFSMFFFLSQYLQEVLGFSAIATGLAFLPLTGVMFAMVQVTPLIASRLGNARTVVAALSIAVIGMAMLSRLSSSSSYFPDIVIPMTVLGLGMGSAFIPATALSLSNVGPQDAGAASGLLNVSQQLGGSLGLAILVTVFGAGSRSAAHDPVSIAGSSTEVSYELAAGVSDVITGSAVFLLLALAVVFFVVRRPTRHESALALGATHEANA